MKISISRLRLKQTLYTQKTDLNEGGLIILHSTVRYSKCVGWNLLCQIYKHTRDRVFMSIYEHGKENIGTGV